MVEMIERAAKAFRYRVVLDYFNNAYQVVDVDTDDAAHAFDSEADAHYLANKLNACAAVAALREPINGMIWAAIDALPSRRLDADEVIAIWKAAIDAALAAHNAPDVAGRQP